MTVPMDKRRIGRAGLLAAAKARGIEIPAAQVPPALAGANWLRDCVALLRKTGFK